MGSAGTTSTGAGSDGGSTAAGSLADGGSPSFSGGGSTAAGSLADGGSFSGGGGGSGSGGSQCAELDADACSTDENCAAVGSCDSPPACYESSDEQVYVPIPILLCLRSLHARTDILSGCRDLTCGPVHNA